MENVKDNNYIHADPKQRSDFAEFIYFFNLNRLSQVGCLICLGQVMLDVMSLRISYARYKKNTLQYMQL